MILSPEDRQELIGIIQSEFHAKADGGKRNLLFPNCPFCGHDGGKYAIYVGPTTSDKFFGASHCFSCGRSCKGLKQTLEILGRDDLNIAETAELEEDLESELMLFEDDIDDDLVEVDMPKGYKRVYKHQYLKDRGWRADDYGYFEVGFNRGMDWRFDDYVIIPIIEDGIKVGYVARHVWSKSEIEEYNDRHRRKILRYRNSTEKEGNGFEKLLYNIDALEPYVTDTVILCEGVFDVVGITRKLELYDNEKIQAVATFGKKVSKAQLYKLQSKGVKTIVIGYDQDAIDTTMSLSKELEQYFDVFIIDIPQFWECKDFDEMSSQQIYELFSEHLLTVREFNLNGEL